MPLVCGQCFYRFMVEFYKKKLSIAFLSLFFVFSLTPSLSAKTPRTDGPEGSEYGPTQWLDGDLQIGFEFGGVLDGDDSDENGMFIGGDIDYRPYDVFGARFTVQQTLKSPRNTLIHLTPMLHVDFLNLSAFVSAGPGVSIVNAGGTSAKFSAAFGGGGDFFLGQYFGLGAHYHYVTIFDSSDIHTIGARIFVRFPGDPF